MHLRVDALIAVLRVNNTADSGNQASVVGTYFGSTRWKGSSKTVEGSAAAWLSMCAATAMLFSLHGVDPGLQTAVRTVVGITIAVALEAVTQQHDNLVLPLAFHALLALVRINSA